PDDYRQCLREVGLTYRTWAIAHSQDYALIFGTPIPDYVAPETITNPPAKRSMRAIISLLIAAAQDGKLDPAPAYTNPPVALQTQLLAWAAQYDFPASIPALYLALAGWSRFHGLVQLEIFNHLRHVVDDAAVLYRAEVLAFIEQAGIV
ncbi:MAG TPA: hypothetical protein G4N96_11675, partial [Chloroflexi bacterium]|nr:hypothetical protein [Chloroflexota bacterium]